ncbi:MAG: AbrB/MazE/SpoVT family DNA-binding domain-containing protein [Clostridia bacterium]|nr:AbrB/MazE/SpoVT family DNA-binding domain-containing protein [Clostridia bacterium]
MKSLGIVRKIDELGRIVLPIETRRSLDLNSGDGVEIFVEKDKIVLQKYAPSCIFCGEAGDVIVYKNKRVCQNCLSELVRK